MENSNPRGQGAPEGSVGAETKQTARARRGQAMRVFPGSKFLLWPAGRGGLPLLWWRLARCLLGSRKWGRLSQFTEREEVDMDISTSGYGTSWTRGRGSREARLLRLLFFITLLFSGGVPSGSHLACPSIPFWMVSWLWPPPAHEPCPPLHP